MCKISEALEGKQISRLSYAFIITISKTKGILNHHNLSQNIILKKLYFDVRVYFFINIGVWVSLHIPRLIPQTLKLMTIQASSGPEVCGTQISDFYGANPEYDQLSYTSQS